MDKFIELHLVGKSRAVWVNILHVVWFDSLDDDTTYIHLVDGSALHAEGNIDTFLELIKN